MMKSRARTSAGWRSPRRILWVLAWLSLWVAGTLQAVVLPAGFTRQEIGTDWNGVVGLTFAEDGRMLAWEREGRIWIVDTNGVKSAQPMLDISDEVGGWRDYGLLGVALHPNFLNNGYIYLLYVVDHHHLTKAGTTNYSAVTDEYFMPSIGRITRYTAEVANNFQTVDYSSRLILLGESITNGFPIVHQSHGTGTILFGEDGTLIASCGDGASYSGVDTGGPVHGSYAVQALSEGILRPKENVGALRAQLVDCLNGKIVRIDAATGDGVPSNPFYDPLAPRAPRSRVWALGLRNPFRMTIRHESGSHNPEEADPGTLYIGDVGWATWEDLNVCKTAGQNFGWPLYEGMLAHPDYHAADVYNLDAPNPRFGINGCTQEYFYFRDLLVQETLNTPSWPNPCEPGQQVPSTIPRMMHTRPAADWRHATAQSRTGTFDPNGNAIVYDLDDPGSPVPGPRFAGNSSTGGTWYEGTDFPAMYQNTYFHGDYGAQWIRNFVFDTNDDLVLVRDFMTEGGGVVFVGTHPTDGNLYYVEWGTTIWKITYNPGGNQPPMALFTATPTYGLSPLLVDFAASPSSDPDGVIVDYHWDFGDGTTTNGTDAPSHVFTAPGGLLTNYTVTLVVEDDAGAFSTNRVTVHMNNTPPTVTITTPTNGTLYPLSGDTIYALQASVADAEHSLNELSYEWVTYLHHNEHAHSEPVDTNISTTTLISPLGCGEETYFYRVDLTVTDPLGLSALDQVYLYPDCPPPSTPSNLVAHALSVSSIRLTWQDRSSTELGFIIERSYNGTDFIVVGTNAPNQTAFTDLGLRSGTVHHYRLKAFSMAGPSAYSGQAQAATFAGGAAAFQQEGGGDGLVVFEAEHFDLNTPQGGKAWVTNETAGYSGSAALQAMPNTGVGINTGYALNSPRLDFEVNFAKAGTHFVWVRGIGLSGTDDSCHAGLDGNELATSDRISTFGTNWTWSKTTMDAAADAWFVVPATGVHTVNLWMREDGTIVDKLLLTTNAGYTPAGQGPMESPRTGLVTPPTISSVVDQWMEEDTSLGPIGFSVGDSETYGENLLVMSTSANTNLIRDQDLVLGGSGTNRHLTLTPLPDQSGVSVITIVVSDGYTSTNETFEVTVTPVNDLPLAVADTLTRYMTQGVQAPASNLLTNDFDADGDVMMLDGVVSPTALGAIVTITNALLRYEPPFGETNGDNFAYILSDGHGGQGTGFVTVAVQADPPPTEVVAIQTAAGAYTLEFLGEPGFKYTIQYSDSLHPSAWTHLATVTAGASGQVQLTDDTPGSGPTRFYRAVRGAAP